jgi:3-phenylpropionate/trans-cinnamate dioxygenase ferredoxin component
MPVKEAVANLSELKPGCLLQVRSADGRLICLARTASGHVFAIDDECSHEEQSLCEGDLIDNEVECPMHYSRFDLRTGAPTSLPALDPVRTYPVTVDGDSIFVEVS